MKTCFWFLAAVALSMLLVLGFSGCARNDSGDDDDDDDGSPIPDDDDTVIGCEGRDFGQCDAIDAPQLSSVQPRVNGTSVPFPAEVRTDDSLELVFEYVGPSTEIEEGYPFVIVGGEPNCLESQQLLSLNCPEQTEGVCRIDADPLLFLDGIGAPYGLEISNYCGEHSNRLPLDIVAHEAK